MDIEAASLSIGIILGLGAVAGYFCHRYSPRFWPATISAAGIATVLWVGAIYIHFFAVAPSELGPPLLGPVVQVYLIATVWKKSAVLNLSLPSSPLLLQGEVFSVQRYNKKNGFTVQLIEAHRSQFSGSVGGFADVELEQGILYGRGGQEIRFGAVCGNRWV